MNGEPTTMKTPDTRHADVRRLFDSLRQGAEEGVAPSSLRAALADAGLRVDESSSIHYRIVWCDDIGEFKWICEETVDFLLGLTGESVTVRVEEKTVLE